MLNKDERHEIDNEIARYPDRRAAGIEALKIVQRHRGGWVSDEGVRDIAEYLQMSPAEVDSVATFYNLVFRQPVGRHVIMLCDSVSCWLTGYADIRAHLRERLGVDYGGTTADGRFTLLPIVCLGHCERAPAMMVDEDIHTELTPERVDDILQRYS